MLRGFLRWVGRFAYVGVLGTLFVLTAYSAFSVFVRRGVTPVPGLVGLDLQEAKQLLGDHGLALVHREETDRFTDEVALGRIMEQRPVAGSLAKRGGRIDVVLSRGKRLVEVPDLSGRALPAAQVTLAAVGLAVGATASVFSSAGPVGTVVLQDPTPGDQVDRGAPVTLFLIADGLVDTFVMPDLVDKEYRLVRHFLDTRGFRLGSIKFEPYEGVSDSIVLRQFPLPGHPLRRDDVISLVVAAVPEPESLGEAEGDA